MRTACLVVRSLAPSAEATGLISRLDSHVATCLPCQAELARYGRLRRQLAALNEVIVPAPGNLVPTVGWAIAAVEARKPGYVRSAHPGRTAAAAGAVVAAAAGAAAVAAWRRRELLRNPGFTLSPLPSYTPGSGPRPMLRGVAPIG